MTESENSLRTIEDEHEHDASRIVVQEVSGGRKILTCHECQTYIAQNREDTDGWIRA
jgi:hypothetical protein